MLVSGLALAMLCASGTALADRGETFKSISTIANYLNNEDLATETVSEIVSVTADGRTQVYTDAETN
jgi:hypothetical protein